MREPEDPELDRLVELALDALDASAEEDWLYGWYCRWPGGGGAVDMDMDQLVRALRRVGWRAPDD